MLKTINEVILTAGPTITNKEVDYVLDAVMNGWNHHHSDYIRKFEQTFAEYIGVKYAVATSSCTGALHLALAGLGVGPGDEVILPETSWVATASAIKYVGATPVFVDIEPDTWVMDSRKVEKYITSKTKVIIPVHLYGNPVDMEPLWELAKKCDLKILEDAAPSIGALYKKNKTGSLGDAAAFSFQGAKAMVTGEGGMFVTNNEELYMRVRLLGDHGRNPLKPLTCTEIGFKYKMSNIQAALGLAQLERIEEIVAKKRKIFNWYHDRLKHIKTLKMNIEKPKTRNLYWMSSIVLDKSINISRDEFIMKLKERNIDSRPFFSPLSSFPMFKSTTEKNPVAYDIPLRGINLPSGHHLSEEEVDYICENIKEIINNDSGIDINKFYQPLGWLNFRDNTNDMIAKYKSCANTELSKTCIEIKEKGAYKGRLRPVTYWSLDNDNEIEMLTNWRKKAQIWFPTQFEVTKEGTKNWLKNSVLQKKDRILFWVDDEKNNPIGHVGLNRFDYRKKFCEIDNIVRGEKTESKKAMYLACDKLIDWAIHELKVNNLYLRVTSDNERARTLYEKLSFIEIQKTPLMRIEEQEIVHWREIVGNPYYETDRYSVTMKYKRIINDVANN